MVRNGMGIEPTISGDITRTTSLLFFSVVLFYYVDYSLFYFNYNYLYFSLYIYLYILDFV
jgi:hypothetical protein